MYTRAAIEGFAQQIDDEIHRDAVFSAIRKIPFMREPTTTVQMCHSGDLEEACRLAEVPEELIEEFHRRALEFLSEAEAACFFQPTTLNALQRRWRAAISDADIGSY